MDGFVEVIVWAVAAAIYLLPTIVAVGTRKRNTRAIFAVNVLLGWTFVGWVVALVWAFAFERAEPAWSDESMADAERVPSATATHRASTPPNSDSTAPSSMPIWKPIPVQGQRVKLLVDSVAREGPDRSAAATVEIASGTDVTVIHTRDAWAWVQTDAGEEGWVEL